MRPALHQTIARERHAELRREVERARRAAGGSRETPWLAGFTPAFVKLEGLGFLARRRPHPGT